MTRSYRRAKPLTLVEDLMRFGPILKSEVLERFGHSTLEAFFADRFGLLRETALGLCVVLNSKRTRGKEHQQDFAASTLLACLLTRDLLREKVLTGWSISLRSHDINILTNDRQTLWILGRWERPSKRAIQSRYARAKLLPTAVTICVFAKRRPRYAGLAIIPEIIHRAPVR